MAGHRGDRDTGGEDKDTLSTWSWTPTLCPDLPPRASLNPPSSPPAPQTAPPPRSEDSVSPNLLPRHPPPQTSPPRVPTTPHTPQPAP